MCSKSDSWRRLADRGDPDAQVRYAWTLEGGGEGEVDLAGAARYYKMAADQGNAQGRYYYAMCLRHGDGVEQDPAAAAGLFKILADEGDAIGQRSYGWCLRNGFGIEKNETVAVQYFKMAMDQGHAQGYNNYAFCLEHGMGIGKNRKDAATYYKKAADGGADMAMVSYGLCLERGIGCEKDPITAVKYYKKSAGQGCTYGKFFYELCLKNGVGVEKVKRSNKVDDWIIELGDYAFTRVYGESTSATVSLYNNKSSTDAFAVKQLKNTVANVSENFKLAMSLLIRVEHICTVEVRGIVMPIDDIGPIIVTKFLKDGCLMDLLRGKGGRRSTLLDQTNVSQIVAGIVFAMRYLHSLGIIHRDLKPTNILLDKDVRAYVCDYYIGEFERLIVTKTNGTGSPAYTAPEIYNDDGCYCPKVDVFSFGMILYELIFGRQCITGTDAEIQEKVMNGERGSLDITDCPSAHGVDTVVLELIEACWSGNAAHRPTFSGIFELLASIDFELFDSVDEGILGRFIDPIRRLDARRILKPSQHDFAPLITQK